MAKKQQCTRPADVLPSGLYLAEITHSAGSLVGPAAIQFTIVFGEYKGQELNFIYGILLFLLFGRHTLRKLLI